MALPRKFHGARKPVEPPTADPRQGLVDILLANSKGTSFEEVRREWTFDGGYIAADDERFLEHCPCGAKLEVANYLLKNPGTGRTIILGSRCIQRFVLLNGAETQEDSRSIFERQVKAIKRNADLVKLWPDMLRPRVQSQSLYRFRSLAQDFLGTLDPAHMAPDRWESFLALLSLTEADRDEKKRLRDVLFKPADVPKEDKVIQLETRSEEEIRRDIGVWRKAGRARVTTSLSDSEIYHPETFVERKERKGRKGRG